jgi:hypothetical protein
MPSGGLSCVVVVNGNSGMSHESEDRRRDRQRAIKASRLCSRSENSWRFEIKGVDECY